MVGLFVDELGCSGGAERKMLQFYHPFTNLIYPKIRQLQTVIMQRAPFRPATLTFRMWAKSSPPVNTNVKEQQRAFQVGMTTSQPAVGNITERCYFSEIRNKEVLISGSARAGNCLLPEPEWQRPWDGSQILEGGGKYTLEASVFYRRAHGLCIRMSRTHFAQKDAWQRINYTKAHL